MSRLQKKCFYASATFHGVLLGALIIGPAFLTSKPKSDPMPLLEVIPANLVDALISGGGSPNAAPPAPIKAPPQAAVQEPVKPPPQQPPETKPDPVPEKVKAPEPKIKEESKPELEEREKPIVSDDPIPVRKPKTPKKPVKKPEVDKQDEPEKPAKQPPEKRHIFTEDAKTVKRSNAEAIAKQQAQEEARAQELARYEAAQKTRAEAFNRSFGNIKNNLSTGTSIEMPGPGGGGEAFANYGQAVKSIYDHAWIAPSGVNDDSLNTKVKIVVNKDGSIVSSAVLRGSGNRAMDKSIETVLARVRSLPPFPEGATDTQRTFQITFNLKAKLQL